MKPRTSRFGVERDRGEQRGATTAGDHLDERR